ncbi:MAG TPA: HAD family hydrolase [Gaiellaceae bacterium]
MDRWATFDCYGTLIDWNGGIRAELARVFADDLVPDEAEESGEEEPTEEEAQEAVDAKLDRLLQRYHAFEREIERDGSLSYRDVMGEAMRRLGAPEAEVGGLADSLPGWQPFPEAHESLMELRERGWKLAILSNSDLDLIEASKGLLGVPFEETVVASQIRSYKPALMHWMEFYGRTLANRRRHVHVAASSYHDIAPAAKLKIPNIWINRLGEHAQTAPTRELPDLTELPATADELMPA